MELLKSGPWLYAADEPAARRISLHGTSGTPQVYSRAQAKMADMYLNTESPEAVRLRNIPGASDPTPPGSTPDPNVPPFTGTGTPATGPGKTSSSGGCAVAGGSGGMAALVLLVAGVGVLRRRRRR